MRWYKILNLLKLDTVMTKDYHKIKDIDSCKCLIYWFVTVFLHTYKKETENSHPKKFKGKWVCGLIFLKEQMDWSCYSLLLLNLVLLALLVTIWSFLVLVAKCVDCFIILSTKNVYCFSCTIKKGDSSQANDNILLKMIVPYFILRIFLKM